MIILCGTRLYKNMLHAECSFIINFVYLSHMAAGFGSVNHRSY